MDCLKNLTACLGCTKKHAKCSWKDVTDDELQNYTPPEPHRDELDEGLSERSRSHTAVEIEKRRDYAVGVRDAELLGEEESDEEAGAPYGNGRQSPIQVHVAGSVQSANGNTVEHENSEDVDVDMEAEVQRDIAELQASDAVALPSPPGAPVPPPASLPDMPTIRSEAPPDVETEEQKPVLLMSPPPPEATYGNSEYGTFNSVNGLSTSHGLPEPPIGATTPLPAPVFDYASPEQSETEAQAEVAYPSIPAPEATTAPMATTITGSSVGKTEA